MFTSDVLSRFDAKVVKMDSGCHEWSGSKDEDGYGYFCVLGRTVKAHRFSIMRATGAEIPEGMCVCHSCDNPKCVNPAHLWLGTNADNTADRVVKGRTSRQGAPPKLTDEQVMEVIGMLATGEHSCADVARHFGVTKALITKIRKGEVRSDVTGALDLSVTDQYRKQRNDGHHNPNAKLSPDDVNGIIALRAGGLSQQKIADRYGVTQTCISRVLRTHLQ